VGDLKAATATHGKIQHLFIVDTVEAQQIDVVELQILHRLMNVAREFLRIGARADLGFRTIIRSRGRRWENFTQLDSEVPLASGGFNGG